MDILVSNDLPTGEEYNNLRVVAGLSPKDVKASEIGLKNSIYMVSLRDGDKLIGMGRIIGDGGCMYHIVDIAVEPSYQGKGLGKLIMSKLDEYLNENAPRTSYVSLIADIPADKLYEQFGYVDTKPRSIGMAKRY